MKAIILAAGRGSRMGQLTEHQPKCLVELKGKPLLHYQLEAIRANAIHDIAIVCGYQQDKIQSPFIKEKFINSHWQTTNMVRSLLCADAWLTSEDCIVSYSDIFYQSSAIQSLIRVKADIAILYDLNFKQLWSARFENPLADLETFQVDVNHSLTEIGSRAASIDQIHGQYMGLLKISRHGWRLIKSCLLGYTDDELNKLDMTSLLKKLIHLNVAIQAVPYQEQWGEVDQLSDLNLYEQ